MVPPPFLSLVESFCSRQEPTETTLRVPKKERSKERVGGRVRKSGKERKKEREKEIGIIDDLEKPRGRSAVQCCWCRRGSCIFGSPETNNSSLTV